MAAGLTIGMPVADARAALHELQLVAQDDDECIRQMERLKPIFASFTPLFSLEKLHEGLYFGAYLNIRGCVPLFTDQESLLAALSEKLLALGHKHRMGLGAGDEEAWGQAIYGGQTINKGAHQHLPIAALRLPRQAGSSLRKLGCRNIADLQKIKGEDFAKRFGLAAWERLARFRGQLPSPPRKSEYREDDREITRDFALPLREEDCRPMLHLMLPELLKKLNDEGVMLQLLSVCLKSPDHSGRSSLQVMDVATQSPTNSEKIWAQLIDIELEKIGAHKSISNISMTAQVINGQPFPTPNLGANHDERQRRWLLERLSQRLGPHHVLGFQPGQSTLPERRACPVSAIYAEPMDMHASPKDNICDPEEFLHPSVMLNPAEVIDLVVPPAHGEPPMRWHWRGVSHDRAAMFGPDHHVPEWWLDLPSWRGGMRSYWWVQNRAGQWFWMYRNKGAGRECWYVHGY